jgi:hypothetical protein
MMYVLALAKYLADGGARRRRAATPDELRWEDASGLFTIAAAFAVGVLAILTLIG